MKPFSKGLAKRGWPSGPSRQKCGYLNFTDEFKSCPPVNFTDSKTQPFHESSPSPWQQRPPSLSRGRRPPRRRR